jgi:hypothetical protein
MKLASQATLSSRHRAVKTLLAGGVFLGLLTVFFVPSADLPFAACAFQSITGHSCLTCGMTRSLHAVSHGHLMASLRYHLFGPIVFIIMILSFMIFMAEGISGKNLAPQPTRKQSMQLFVPFAVIWLIYWGARFITEH